MLADLVTFVGSRELTIPVAEGWRDTLLASGLKPSTVDNYLRVGGFFFRWLVTAGYAGYNLFHYVKRPKFNYNEARAKRMTEDEFQRAKAHLHRGNRDCYYLLLMTYHAGMRISDACLLQREHINWETMELSFKPYKTRKIATANATFPLECDPCQPTYDVTQILIEMCDRPVEPHWSKLNFVMPHLASDYMGHSRRVPMRLKRSLMEIGINRTSHTGRRAFCSAIANHSGMSPVAAARLTGQSIATFSSYVTPDPDAARLAIRTAFQVSEQLCKKKQEILLKPALHTPKPSPPPSEGGGPQAGQ
jgi:integrase